MSTLDLQSIVIACLHSLYVATCNKTRWPKKRIKFVHGSMSERGKGGGGVGRSFGGLWEIVRSSEGGKVKCRFNLPQLCGLQGVPMSGVFHLAEIPHIAVAWEFL